MPGFRLQKNEFLRAEPLQGEPANRARNNRMKSLGKTAIFTSITAATYSGCTDNGGPGGVLSWIFGTAAVAAFVLAGLFANVLLQNHKTRKNGVSSRTQIRRTEPVAENRTFPPGYILGATPVPEPLEHVETAGERASRRFTVVKPGAVSIYPFTPTWFYVPKDDDGHHSEFANFLSNARSRNGAGREMKSRSQERNRELFSRLAEMMGNLVPGITRLKFHPPRVPSDHEIEKLDALIRCTRDDVASMNAACESGDYPGMVHAAMHSLARIEDFAEWNKAHGSSPLLTVNMASIAGPLRGCLEEIGVEKVANVYFYRGKSSADTSDGRRRTFGSS